MLRKTIGCRRLPSAPAHSRPLPPALLLLLLAPLYAQEPSLAAGRVVRTAGADSLPVAGARVLLHRIGRKVQGPVDSTVTDREGRFRFRFTVDTSAVFLASSRHQGIEYFSSAVRQNAASPDTTLRVVVSDTASDAPVELAARHLVVAEPGEDGSRGVLDLVVLRNRTDRTRVAPDSTRPSWSAALPSGTFGFEPGEGDVSTDALRRVGNRVELLAPVAPGEKQLILQYGLPAAARSLELPFEQPAELVDVLVPDRRARVSGGALAPADTEVIQGRTYHRWMGSVPAGGTVRIELPGPATAPPWLLPVLVAIVGLSLIVATSAVLRRRSLAVARVSPRALEVDGLVERIARMDARYAGRETETDPMEWAGYHAERARLKAELEAMLAARSDRP